ncbi:MAG: hypothetical protein JJ992_03170, partial [Planctomycetes bacterium]|nr:hypothetical protein [Planctomycetota bacterium]
MDDASGLPSRHPRALSWPLRIAFLYAGVALPFLCHVMTATDPPDAPSWQSGTLNDKLAYTLTGPAGVFFYPLMLYPMVSLALFVAREDRFAGHAAVRFGVYSGIPVAAWYCAMLGIAEASVSEWWSFEWMRVLLIAGLAILPPLTLWGLVRLAIWLHHRFRPTVRFYLVAALLLTITRPSPEGIL